MNILHLPDLVWNLLLAPTVSRAWTRPTGFLAQERPLEELKALEERIQFYSLDTLPPLGSGLAITELFYLLIPCSFATDLFRLLKWVCPLFLQSWGSKSFLLLQTHLLHSHPCEFPFNPSHIFALLLLLLSRFSRVRLCATP